MGSVAQLDRATAFEAVGLRVRVPPGPPPPWLQILLPCRTPERALVRGRIAHVDEGLAQPLLRYSGRVKYHIDGLLQRVRLRRGHPGNALQRLGHGPHASVAVDAGYTERPLHCLSPSISVL